MTSMIIQPEIVRMVSLDEVREKEENRLLYAELKAQLNSKTLRENVRDNIDLVKSMLIAGRHLSVSTSMFKDSATISGQVVTAIVECVREGHSIQPVHFTTIDTLQEMPEAHNLVEHTYEQLQAFAEAEGIAEYIRVHIASPSIRNKYQNVLAAGLTLPSYAKGASACVQDLKLTPIQRVASKIRRDIPKGEYLISIIGTRIDESTVRKGRMLKSGSLGFLQDAYKEVKKNGKVIERVKTHEELCLIALWDTEMNRRTGAGVMNYLSQASTDNPIPEFRTFSNFNSQLLLYMEGSASECVVGLGTQSEGSIKSSCGTARFGCWNCQKPVQDTTAENQVKLDRYAFKRNLLKIRNWVSFIENDTSRRRWVQKANHEVAYNYHRISPNAWDAQTCYEFLSYLLTADVEEMERAEHFNLLAATGSLKEDAGIRDILSHVMFGPEEDVDLEIDYVLNNPEYRNHKRRTALRSYIEQSSRIRFRNITEADLIFIDAIWSRDVLHPPFTAVRLWNMVYNEGKRFYAPEVDLSKKERGLFQRPKELYLKVKRPPFYRLGMAEPLDGLLIDQGGDNGMFVQTAGGHVFHSDLQYIHGKGNKKSVGTAGTGWKLNVDRESEITVDQETAAFLLHYDISHYVGRKGAAVGNFNDDWTYGFKHWLRLGVLSLKTGSYAENERMLMRGQSWQLNGLHGQLKLEALLQRAVPHEKVQAIVARVERFKALHEARKLAEIANQRAAYELDPIGYEIRRLRAIWAKESSSIQKLMAKQIAFKSVVDHAKVTGREARSIDGEDAVSCLKALNSHLKVVESLTTVDQLLGQGFWIHSKSVLHTNPEAAETITAEFRKEWLETRARVLRGALEVFEHVRKTKTIWGCMSMFEVGFGMTMKIHDINAQQAAVEAELDEINAQLYAHQPEGHQYNLF